MYKRTILKIFKKNSEFLENEEEIELQYKRHLLKGNMKEYEVIHIKSDCLLVFRIKNEYLNLVMLGKHTQVYKKFIIYLISNKNESS